MPTMFYYIVTNYNNMIQPIQIKIISTKIKIDYFLKSFIISYCNILYLKLKK